MTETKAKGLAELERAVIPIGDINPWAKNPRQVGKKLLICDRCGTEFLRHPSKIRGKHNYCERGCYGLSIKGRRLSPATEFKPGQISPNKGQGMPIEQKKGVRKVSLKKYNNTPERRKYMRIYGNRYREIGKKKEVGSRYYHSPKGNITSKANAHSRRARELGAGGKFDVAYWSWLCCRLDYRCQICGNQFPMEKLTPDHIIPLKKGGDNRRGNIQPLCKSCNCRKQDVLIPVSEAMRNAQAVWPGMLYAQAT
jgi:5-methylcytosine-specific restriction endonuclease McrA